MPFWMHEPARKDSQHGTSPAEISAVEEPRHTSAEDELRQERAQKRVLIKDIAELTEENETLKEELKRRDEKARAPVLPP